MLFNSLSPATGSRLFLCAHRHASWCLYGSQRSTRKKHSVLPTTMRVLRIKLRLPGMATGTLIHWVFSPPCVNLFTVLHISPLQILGNRFLYEHILWPLSRTISWGNPGLAFLTLSDCFNSTCQCPSIRIFLLLWPDTTCCLSLCSQSTECEWTHGYGSDLHPSYRKSKSTVSKEHFGHREEISWGQAPNRIEGN